MLPFTSKELKEIIKEKEKRGENTTKIKEALKKFKSRKRNLRSLKEVKIGEYMYFSTGLIKKEDFE